MTDKPLMPDDPRLMRHGDHITPGWMRDEASLAELAALEPGSIVPGEPTPTGLPLLTILRGKSNSTVWWRMK